MTKEEDVDDEYSIHRFAKIVITVLLKFFILLYLRCMKEICMTKEEDVDDEDSIHRFVKNYLFYYLLSLKVLIHLFLGIWDLIYLKSYMV